MKTWTLFALVASVSIPGLAQSPTPTPTLTRQERVTIAVARIKEQKQKEEAERLEKAKQFHARVQYEAEVGDAGAAPEVMQDGSIKIVKDYFARTLKDPMSAIYERWSKLVATRDPIAENVASRAWLVSVAINAKNSYGGYTGSQWYAVYIKNGKVIFCESRD